MHRKNITSISKVLLQMFLLRMRLKWTVVLGSSQFREKH